MAPRLVLAVLGLALVGLAAPRLLAAALLLEGGPALARLERGAAVSPHAVERLAVGAEAARAIVESPEAWRRLMAAGVPGAAAGLARTAPTDAYAWARLAHDRLTAGDVAGARAAARRSLALGPWERRLIVDRLPVLARVAETPDDHAALAAQLRRAWDWRRPRLLRLLPPAVAWPLYRRALAGDPGALSEAAAASGLFASRVGAD